MKKLCKLLAQSRRLYVLIAIGAVLGFVMAGCDNGGGTSITGAFTGTYTGNAGGANFTVVVTATAWSISGATNDTGTYVLNAAGDSAVLYDSASVNIGTATKSGNTLVVVLNVASGSPGTYTAAKVSG
jgi:membrane-bound inhibitor of C-type lysozyme